MYLLGYVMYLLGYVIYLLGYEMYLLDYVPRGLCYYYIRPTAVIRKNPFFLAQYSYHHGPRLINTNIQPRTPRAIFVNGKR